VRTLVFQFRVLADFQGNDTPMPEPVAPKRDSSSQSDLVG